ncbi:ATP-binding protein [Azovibrio restrictus]|uniref:HAMP domain-containing sensor histidine kinase n=1 Tax=Azovibrio restrictus TaxID=146938 RepID=UPI0026EBF474|nr:ATP-binding protein [Azovibrio restrictus]MDD3483769.1 ATP-binding protein [Azovibrio restrictus]
MIRISFRQGMLAGFTVIVLLLGGAALQSWLMLERLADRSRHGSEQAVQLSATLQELGERGTDLERSTRQYLLVRKAAFRQGFDGALAQALSLIQRLEAQQEVPLQPLLEEWRSTAQALAESLEGPVEPALLGTRLARLTELQGRMRQLGQQWVEAHNQRLLAELEANRLQLGLQLLLALGGALLAALAMGWWLVRPVRQLEDAIVRLGASRFDAAVQVGGPVDLRQLGQRLDWLRQRLAELESDRERTLRHVSHELKTPLTALKEGVALLQEEVPGPLSEGQREVVEILRHNVAALQKQIENLLSMNALAFEARRLQRRPVALRPLLEQAAAARELHAQARGLQVQVLAPDATASLDPEKVSVVLDNLLSNAIDFSPEGGQITLTASLGSQGLRLECRDQGVGVAPEEAARIFEPFYQGQRRPPVPRQGSGVGLSIVRELVHAMGGRVSLLGGGPGAHFCVDLPHET